MDYITKFKKQLAIHTVALAFFPLLTVAGASYVTISYLNLDSIFSLIIIVFSGVISGLIASVLMLKNAARPVESLTEVITYAANSERTDNPPDISHLVIAHDLVEGLSRLVYDLASKPTTTDNVSITHDAHLIDAFGIPLLGINNEQRITIANKATAEYIGKDLKDILDKPLNDVISLNFQSEDTLEKWLEGVHDNSITATKAWDRVRHEIDSDHSKQFDMVASFSSGSSSGTDTMLALFDHSDRYNQEDQEVSFVALAVHELRTPLTIMRGYIEVFEDELGPTLSPELTDFMHKMHASAQQLSSFVSNILNVARIEENQLSLKLRKDDWAVILKTATDDLELRAGVHGKHLELKVAEDLPAVAVDRISAHEVINNLVDNAIKYSGNSKKIVITASLNSEGMVETSVQDFGIGIPTAVMTELFQKFHRSHKSRVQVGGTGLGLYLSKALINAHGGNIWVRSKEGEGSTFSFTLVPFDKIGDEQIDGEDGIIRGAHGWIKNHSLYRN